MNTRMTAVLTDVKSTVLDLKPYAHIDKLISTVLPFTERHILAKGEIIQYHNNDVRLCFSCYTAALRCIVVAMVLF